MCCSRRVAALVLAASIGVASGCSGKSKSTAASRLVFGGPKSCLTERTCLIGLQRVYGLHFKQFKSLDTGVRMERALTKGQVQVARLKSSDYAIGQHGWVVLQDDKHLQPAGNIVPVIRTSKALPEIDSLLNAVSSGIIQDDLFNLNKQVELAHSDPAIVAKQFVASKGLASVSVGGTKETLTIGSSSASENVVLAAIYAEVLRDAGYSVVLRTGLGGRDTTERLLEGGQIDLVPEYAGSYLLYLDPKAGSLPLDRTESALGIDAASRGLTVLAASSATDTDAIVVTRATARKYHLTMISDLAKKR
jgi:osmoprotectant transport system substrate-binding protein